MRRGLLVLCLAGLLLASPAPEARAADVGALSGSYTETGPGEWTFSRINFAGTLTSGKKTYAGQFHIVKGLIGRGEEVQGGCFLDVNCFFPGASRFMLTFNTVAIRGDTDGQSLKGSCGGAQSRSYPYGPHNMAKPMRSFQFRCSISVGGSSSRPIMIRGTAAEYPLDGKFEGAYTAAAP